MTHNFIALLLLLICSRFVNAVSKSRVTPYEELQTIQNNVRIPSLYPPSLKASSHEGYIAESAEMGTAVRVSPSEFSNSLQIAVYDDDLKPGMLPATYEYILTGLGSSLFAVDQRGYVYLNVPHIDADPPNPSTYQLHIEAREVNTTPIRSSEPISIIIHVIDINDNPPRFNSSVYMANVSANGSERSVIKVYATDNDSGKNAQISYHLLSVSNGAYNNFVYDGNTHQLKVIGNLKADERYKAVLEAVDSGGLSSQVVIIVYALPDSFQEVGTTGVQEKKLLGRIQIAGLPNFADTMPLITSTTSGRVDSPELIQTYVTEISEATPPYSIITTLGDDSTKEQMYFKIIAGNEDEKFAISNEIGTLITMKSFDREEKSLYILQIETLSTNSNQHLYWIIVQIAIKDVNDNAPIFTDPQPLRLRVKISDAINLAPNLYVGQVNIKDPDDGDNGRVELRIAHPMDKLFSIDDNGVITINGDLLSGHFGEHRMTIIASDHGDQPLQTRTNLIINIEDARQNIQQSTESKSLQRMNLNSISSHPNIQSTLDFAIPATMQTAARNQTLRYAPVFDPSEIKITVKENQANSELVNLHAYYMDGKFGSITYVMTEGDSSLFSVNSFAGSLHLLRPLDMEEKMSHEIRITTAEASVLFTEPNLPHTAIVTVNVADENDWIPKFEYDSYNFKVNVDTKPGTTIGRIMAYDQDRTATNNEIRYQIKESSSNESYFSLNPKSGLLIVNKDLRPLANTKIWLKIEAADGGSSKQSRGTLAFIEVEPEKIATTVLTKTTSAFDAIPSSNKLHFLERYYSISLLESVALNSLLVLPVLGKPANEHFITCSIISGNNNGVFSISTDSEGNCKLHSQALDREAVDYYQLNISVKTEQQMDHAIVHITVLDTNDNAPKFIYNNGEYDGYFAALSTNASSSALVTTVQAEDSDFKNNSVVVYSLDIFSTDSKYFVVDLTGKIRTKMSASEMMEDGRKNHFNFRVIACDSPLNGKKLCSKAEIFVNIIDESNRFILSILNTEPQHLKTSEREIAKVLREFTGSCTLLFWENVEEKLHNVKQQKQTDMTWYAVNPKTKRSCKIDDYSNLFYKSTMRTIATRLKSKFIISDIRTDVKSVLSKNTLFFTNFKSASFAMIILALTIAVGALIAICAICLCYKEHLMKHHLKRECPNVHQISNFGTIFLPNTQTGSSHDMLYETQMLEIPVEEDDSKVKTVRNGNGTFLATPATLYSSNYDLDIDQNYHDYSQNAFINKSKFSAEENIFSINERNGQYPQKNKKIQRIMVLAPDYFIDQKKSVH